MRSAGSGSTSVLSDSIDLSDLLTQDEAISLLRLDSLNLKRPTEALRYLRRTGQIAYTKVSGKILFPRQAVEDYVRRNLVGVKSTPLD